MSDVLHHARPTQSQMAWIAHRDRFRASIEARAEARKIIPIVCMDKPMPVQINAEEYGPRIPSEDEIAFGPIVHREPPTLKLPQIKLIMSLVSAFYEVSRLDMISERRQAYIVRPRQIAMYLCKTLTLKSLPEIGRQFGGRDHTTALHAVRKIEHLLEGDGRLADEIEVLKLHIRQAVLNQ